MWIRPICPPCFENVEIMWEENLQNSCVLVAVPLW
jgi:hypothetical protein